ncbi:MAG: DUF192 domain-containing protein [Novosphingobium sp.]|nr:DUF192 domain-containing protein [Novosphingobium sp.]
MQPVPDKSFRARAAILVAAVVWLAVALGCAASAARAEETLTIDTANGAVAFTVELALTSEEQARGLMFRNSLAERHGMLFDFGDEREVSMWMKNTLIPLDMLFIRADGTIHRIAANTEPLSLDIIGSHGDVKAVFEIAGGSARTLGVAEGATVHHSIFGTGQ